LSVPSGTGSLGVATLVLSVLMCACPLREGGQSTEEDPSQWCLVDRLSAGEGARLVSRAPDRAGRGWRICGGRVGSDLPEVGRKVGIALASGCAVACL